MAARRTHNRQSLRQHHRGRLNKILSIAGDEGLIQLLWATHALQSSYANSARWFLREDTIPKGADTTEFPSEFSVHKWEIETLTNELMTVPKAKPRTHRLNRTLQIDNFTNSLRLAQRLRKLENAEYTILKAPEDIYLEMGRIGARQFDWRRGFANIPQFYRNAFVYGQGKCSEYFEQKYKISFNRFSLVGFAIFVSLTCHPVLQKDKTWDDLGISWEEVEQVLEIIALPFEQASRIAKETRRKMVHTADKPSVLRQSPCLIFGVNNTRVRAPLPELILERITSGIFYDVVSGGGVVRGDYGHRFELYCLDLLSLSMPSFLWKPEVEYRKKPNTFLSPDILSFSGGQLAVAYECKATRMSHEAMFGRNPISARGYDDLVKAIFQLWRFFSHCRRGFCEFEVADDAVGVVLTLDNWLIMGGTLRKEIFRDAEKMVHDKDAEITKIDRRPIIFIAASELEQTLSVSTEQSFLEALKQSNDKQYEGWRIDGVHRDIVGSAKINSKPYPFADKLGDLLPWWDEMHGQR